MRLIYCFIIFLCPLVSMPQTAALKPLAIGDKVPDIVFSTVLNAPYSTTSLAASFDKLLLVDFWATWCSSCIREFPKLDSLQEKFKGKLEILLINAAKSGDTEKKVLAFFEKQRTTSGKKYTLPVVMNDQVLGNLFPHLTIPHVIWINRGKVLAITEPAMVTTANIHALLNNIPVTLYTKEDQMDFDFHKPLLENGNGGSAAALLYRSVFTSYLSGAGGGVGQMTGPDSLTRRKVYMNKPLLNLYSYAFPELQTNRKLIDTALYPLFFSDTAGIPWRINNYFCYEQVIPYHLTPVWEQHNMQLDLDRQFGLNSRIEKRLISCLVIKLKDSIMLKASTSTSVKNGLDKDDEGYWTLKNTILSHLIETLNRQVGVRGLFPVVIDETGYLLPVSMDLRLKDIHDIPALQKILPQYGLELLEAKKEIQMLVISKANFYKTN